MSRRTAKSYVRAAKGDHEFWRHVEPANRSGPRRPGAEWDPAAGLPRVWGLTSDPPAERHQILNLAAALHWPFEEKPLRFNFFAVLPNLALAVGLLSVKRPYSAHLRPPWPDFVIASGRRAVPVARWIRRRSGGRTRLVHIGPPHAPLALFDLVITTAEYALPRRANVLVTPLTLNWITSAKRCEAACRWLERLSHLPRPRIAVLIDGDTPPYVFDRDVARRLATDVTEQALSAGGSLMVLAVSPQARDAMRMALNAIAPGVPRDVWAGDGASPYAGYLAFANRIVTTGDSAAMLSEACMTGKSVQIFALPEESGFGDRVSRGLRDLVEARPPIRRFVRSRRECLVAWGLIAPARDMGAFHQTLILRRLAVPFGERDHAPIALTAHESICWAAWRVRRLWLDQTRPRAEASKAR